MIDQTLSLGLNDAAHSISVDRARPTRRLVLRLVACPLGLIALAAPAAAQSAPPDAKQWNVNNTSEVTSGTEFELYDRNRQVGYYQQSEGINLGWAGPSGGHFRFLLDIPRPPNVRPERDHRRRLINSPETKVALYNTKARSYLKYGNRNNGQAELSWSTNPSYEWQLHDMSASNGRVHFALFNTRKGLYLVEKLKPGMDLGWHGEAPRSFSLGLSAQQITQGWIPFLGKFPIFGTGRGNLLSVANAGGQSVTLFFVKPGFSTSQCSDPNATERVGPGAAMTALQMKTLYGSATPALPINFLACVGAPGLNISTTFINITYRLN